MTIFGIPARSGTVILRTGDLSVQPSIETRPVSTVLPTTVPTFSSPAAPSTIEFSPYRTSPRRSFSADVLNVSQYTIRNNTLEKIINSGFSSSRPELIGLVDFKPIFTEENAQTKLGNLCFLTFQSELLKKDILTAIKNKLKNSPSLENINQDRERIKNEIETELNFLISGYRTLENIKNCLDIKSLSDNNFDLLEHQNIQNIFTDYLQFSKTSYDSFSNTKILFQLVYDFRKIIETNSYKLFDIRLESRGNRDNNPISINKSNIQQTFYSAGLANAQFPYTEIGLNALNQNIPALPIDRVKFILNFLSKEFRVSKALDELEVQRQLRTNFLSQNIFGNPFDNIFGQIGDDIYQIPIGQNSIASNFLLTAQQNIKVLPFEQKEIDENDNVFLPGTRYFIDSILDSENSTLNLNPLVEFKNNLNTTITNAEILINRLLPSVGNLTQENIFLNFITKIRNSVSTLDTSYENKLQLITIGLLNSARRDPVLKLMLFQYFLLLGLTDNQTNRTDGVFANFAFELRELRGLSFVRLERTENPNLFSGRSGLGIYLERLCETIENHVFPTAELTSEDLNASPNELLSGNLKELLLGALTVETPNLFKNIIEFCKNIYYESAIIKTEINGTKYNNVSTSLFLGLVFEAFSSFCSLFDCGYSQITPNVLTITRNKNTNISILNSLDVLATSERPNFSNTDIFRFSDLSDENNIVNTDNVNAIQNLKSCLIFEDKIIYDFLHVLTVVKSNLSNAVNSSITFFQNSRVQTIGKQNFKKNNLKTSLEIYRQYKQFLESSEFNNFGITQSEYKALSSLLKFQEYKKNTIKIFVVGLPNGITEKIIDKFLKTEITNKIKRKLINLVFYKISAKNTKIIFKPKKIMFDLELSENKFVLNETVEINDNFYQSDGLAEKFSFFDETNLAIEKQANIQLAKTEIYNNQNISTDIQKEIIKNHIKNYIFKIYLRMSTGYNFSEESFPVIPYSETPTEIPTYLSQNLIEFNKEYLRNVLGFSVSEAERITLESNKKIIGRTTAHDDSRLILTAPEFINSTELLKNKILSEKKFEKILLASIDLSSFSVDVEKTSETEEGSEVIKNLIGSSKLIKNLIDDEYYIQNDFDFQLDDYFVSLETV